MVKTRSYTGYFVSKPHKAHRRISWQRILLHYPLVALTVLLCVALVLCYRAPWVNPNASVLFAFLGLAAPVIYLATGVMALIWAIRWNGWFFVPLGVLLMGAGYIPRFFHPALLKHYEQPAERDVLRVMSYNVRGFLEFDSRGKGRSIMTRSAEFINGFEPDILCIQEFQTTPSVLLPQVDSMLSGMPYKAIRYKMEGRNQSGWGLAIYSRWPILASGGINFEQTTNSSLWADIRIGQDTLRVWNNHLQTTQINPSDYEFIMAGHAIDDSDSSRLRTRNILSKLKANYCRRADQVDSIASLIGPDPRRTIVCGDFNDTPVSYTYRVMRDGMKDAFCEKGRDQASTYKGFYSLFRIDYLFFSPDMKIASYQSPPSIFSDHNPVLAEFRLE